MHEKGFLWTVDPRYRGAEVERRRNRKIEKQRNEMTPPPGMIGGSYFSHELRWARIRG